MTLQYRIGVGLMVAAWLSGLALLALVGGCGRIEQAGRVIAAITNQVPVALPTTPSPTTTTVPPGGLVDAIDLSNAVTHGTEARRKPQNARIVCALGTVRVDASKMYLDLTPEARALVSQPGGMGHVLIFTMHNGVPDGGQFDFMREGGQPIKLLENIYGRPAHNEGPRLGRVPDAGSTYWVVLMNNKGTERTAAVEGSNKWVGK